MEADDDNDVMIVEDNDEDESALCAPVDQNETRPIMRLFDRLISNDEKQNTVLTNAQIVSILEQELNMDIDKLHDIEIDMYLMVVKTFLKDWPQWDEFDRVINRFRKINANKSIKNILEHKYKNLKEFLKGLIEKTAALSKETLSKMENRETVDDSNLKDIILEVYCTRKQLNELIYSKPNPKYNNTIFNLVTDMNHQVSLRTIPIEAILNWMSVRVTIDLKFFNYTRSTAHKLKHVLVNEKNSQQDEKIIQNTNIQIKDMKIQSEIVENKKLFELLENILKTVQNGTDYQIIKSVFNVIIMDLNCMVLSELKVPGTYRQCTSKYQYERKLCENIDNQNDKFDLFIKETITPIHIFNISKIGKFDASAMPPFLSWINIECLECKAKFTAEDLRTWFSEHFQTHHNNEKDWSCVNCKIVLPMTAWAEKNWRHVC